MGRVLTILLFLSMVVAAPVNAYYIDYQKSYYNHYEETTLYWDSYVGYDVWEYGNINDFYSPEFCVYSENSESSDSLATVRISYHFDWSIDLTETDNFSMVDYSYAPIDVAALLPESQVVESKVGETTSFDLALKINDCLTAQFDSLPDPIDLSMPAYARIWGEAKMWVELELVDIIPVPESASSVTVYAVVLILLAVHFRQRRKARDRTKNLLPA